MSPTLIETPNAVYRIGYEHHKRPNVEVLQAKTDAVFFEDYGERPKSWWVDGKMSASKEKPPVFLVDVPISFWQDLKPSIRESASWGLKGIGSAALLREGYLYYLKRFGKKAGKTSVQRKVGFFRWLKAGGPIKVGGKMDPSRRRFLKGLAIFGAFAVSEGIFPHLLREFPPSRKTAERIDRKWKDFVLSGRNAIIAQRLEEIVVSKLKKKPGKKPVITVVLGRNHKGFEEQLEYPSFRRETLKKFRSQIEAINPLLVNVGMEHRYDPKKGGYSGKAFPMSPLLKARPRPPDSPMTRRAFFRRPFEKVSEAAKEVRKRQRVRRL